MWSGVRTERLYMTIPMATLALFFGSLSASAGGGTTAHDIQTREDACNRTKATYTQAVDSEIAAGRTYLLKDHPEMKTRMLRSYSDCLAAVVYDATNPDYNLSIGTLMLILSNGQGSTDIHEHGIGYVQNAAAYAYRKQDAIVESRACAMANAFALPGEFRCTEADISQANRGAEAQFASLDPVMLRAQRQNDEAFQTLLASSRS